MYTCDFCSKEFSTSSNKLRHVKYFHSTEDVSSEQSEGESDDIEHNDDENVEIWNMILKRVYNRRYPNPDKIDITAEELLGSKNEVKAIIAVLQNEISDVLEIAQYLENDCGIYRRVQKTLAKLKDEEDYSEKEAQIMAFKNRRYLLHSVLHDHIDVLKQHLDENKDGDEDEDEERPASQHNRLFQAPTMNELSSTHDNQPLFQ